MKRRVLERYDVSDRFSVRHVTTHPRWVIVDNLSNRIIGPHEPDLGIALERARGLTADLGTMFDPATTPERHRC